MVEQHGVGHQVAFLLVDGAAGVFFPGGKAPVDAEGLFQPGEGGEALAHAGLALDAERQGHRLLAVGVRQAAFFEGEDEEGVRGHYFRLEGLLDEVNILYQLRLDRHGGPLVGVGNGDLGGGHAHVAHHHAAVLVLQQGGGAAAGLVGGGHYFAGRGLVLGNFFDLEQREVVGLLGLGFHDDGLAVELGGLAGAQVQPEEAAVHGVEQGAGLADGDNAFEYVVHAPALVGGELYLLELRSVEVLQG